MFRRKFSFLVVDCIERAAEDWPFLLARGSTWPDYSTAFVSALVNLLKGNVAFMQHLLLQTFTSPFELSSLQTSNLLRWLNFLYLRNLIAIKSVISRDMSIDIHVRQYRNLRFYFYNFLNTLMMISIYWIATYFWNYLISE